jgi:hypothetical protein
MAALPTSNPPEPTPGHRPETGASTSTPEPKPSLLKRISGGVMEALGQLLYGGPR